MGKRRKFCVVSRFSRTINRMIFKVMRTKGFPPRAAVSRLLKARNRIFERHGLDRWTWWPATVYCTLPAGYRRRFANTVRVVVDAACPFVSQIDQARYRVGFFVVLPEILEFAGGAWRLIHQAEPDPDDVHSIVVSLFFSNIRRELGGVGGFPSQMLSFCPSKVSS